MNLHVLASALNDLADGRDFYERQGEGLGGYFIDSLFSDVDSLALYAGSHRKVFGFYRLLSKRFPYAIYYHFDKKMWLCTACWIYVKTRAKYAPP
jgi:hypothetical protein